MKTSIISLAAIVAIAGTISTGCESNTEKKEAAHEDVLDAKQDLSEAQNNLNNETYNQAKAQEWAEFKLETEKKIESNEARITSLKKANQRTGKTFDEIYEKRIEALEQKNKDLKSRIDGYDKSKADWESFKREWNHDMDELGKALKDITVNNKK